MDPTHYSEIGTVLRLAREGLGLTLAQASQALHIRAHYLYALETGELTAMPGAAYTKGYLQAYAAFLHLDKDEILRRFEQIKTNIPERGFYFPEVFSKEKKPTPAAVWGALGLAFAAYLLWVVAFKPSARELEIIQPPPQKTATSEENQGPGQLFPLAFNMVNLTCTMAETGLYPPCYSADIVQEVENSPLQLRRPMKTVMEISTVSRAF